MPWSALPEHINTPEEWKGSDWDNPFQKFFLRFKGWFAYGPRAKQSWARWREIPLDLISINATRKERVRDFATQQFLIYTSIIQYYERYSFLVQWPLHLSFHIYWRKKDVMVEPQQGVDHSIKTMLFFRIGARFDNDQVFWMPSIYIGGDWN